MFQFGLSFSLLIISFKDAFHPAKRNYEYYLEPLVSSVLFLYI